MFSVSQIPFSYSGSWLNLSPVLGEGVVSADVHLVTHLAGTNPVLRLVPQLDGHPADTSWETDPVSLRWLHDRGMIEAVFESVDTIRIRGQGLGLRLSAVRQTLSAHSGTYCFTDPVDGSAVFTDYESGRRYRISTLRGRSYLAGAGVLGTADRGTTIEPGDTEPWEIAIEEFTTARPRYEPVKPFELVRRDAAAEFEGFLDDVAPWRSDRTPAAALAAYVLWSAIVRPAGYLGRPAVLMSKHWMDKVWSWDHCFNAIALAAGRPALAMDQFLLPFDHQSESGALPDSVCQWGVLTNFVKPPIHGWALRRIRSRLPAGLDVETLTTIYSKLSAWARFWLDHRRAPGEQLPYYQHGNDSGWDNATVFDAGRVLQTADLSALLVGQLRELAGLAAELHRPAEQRSWAHSADRLQQGLFDQLWNGRRFAARDPATGELSFARSLLNLMPITLGEHLPPGVGGRLVKGLDDHLTDWGLATEAVSSERYRSDGYWQGPIWAPSTVLVEDGLRRAGYRDLAEEVSRRFRKLCEKSGFAENFDAVTGEGLRDRAYTWTASAYLALAGDAEAQSTEAQSTVDSESTVGS
jgi:glycogen debranching enzyme